MQPPTKPPASHDPVAIRVRIKKLIVTRLFIDGLDPETISNGDSLRDEIGLDSIDALELILGLEQEFGVQIVNTGVKRDSFYSVGTLATMVETCLLEQQGRATST